jgi:hypothetical protein
VVEVSRLSKFFDRERRIRSLKIIADQHAKASRLHFNLWQNLTATHFALVGERDALLVDLDEVDEVAGEAIGQVDRFRLCWISARDRAVKLRVEVGALKRQVASVQLRLAEAVQESDRLRGELAKYEQGAIPS